MKIFGREPVAWVGIIAAVAIAVIQTVAGQGLISNALEGKAIDLTNSLSSVALILVPLALNALVARPAVTPIAAPALPAGTTVTVLTPPAVPNTTTVLPAA